MKLIINEKQVGSFEIVKYNFQNIGGKPKIIIEMVKVLDEDGGYLKFAKLEKVVNYLQHFPVTFKQK